MTTYREALDQARKAVDELGASVDALIRVAEASGQGDPAFPLVIDDWNSDLGRAIKRELAAHEAVQSAWRLVDAVRPDLDEEV